MYFENALSKTRGNLILRASAKFIEIDIRTPGLSQEIGNKPICVFLPPTRRLLARNVSTLTRGSFSFGMLCVRTSRTAVQNQVRETDRVPASLRDACVLGYKTCAPLFTTGYNGMLLMSRKGATTRKGRLTKNKIAAERAISMLDVATRTRVKPNIH